MYKLAISTSGEYVSAAIFEEKLLEDLTLVLLLQEQAYIRNKQTHFV